MAKKIAILGSTGSIGTQALQVIDLHPDLIEISALTTYENTELLLQQIKKYRPKYVGIVNREKGEKVLHLIPSNIHVFLGDECLKMICSIPEIDMVLIAVVGIAGLPAVMECIHNKKEIALANKEALVTGGNLVKEALEQTGQKLLPVDSEHSAIFQCLQGLKDPSEVSRLVLTASGGPFRDWDKEQLRCVTTSQALKHPNWSMGRKISIDSATLVNKALEIIEARWLFDISPASIEVVIHPQSIVHSLVEFRDNSILAQMGNPDMRVPILYALTFPYRQTTGVKPLDLIEVGKLTFEKPDYTKFPCLEMAYHVLDEGGTASTVFNAANEIAVSLFLNEKISFLDIPRLIEKAVYKIENIKHPTIEDIYNIDQVTRRYIMEEYQA